MFLSFSFAWLTSFWREKKRNLISNLTTAMMMMAATAVTPVLEKPVSWCTYPTLVCCLSLFFSFFFSLFIRPIWPCRPVCTSSVGKCIYIKKKDGVLILLWLLEEKKEEDKRILLLCVCLNLLPLHFMARWMISTKRRRRRGWTCLSRLLYTCECTRKTPPTSSSCSACPCDIGLNDTDPI